jgi:hypothetical protein
VHLTSAEVGVSVGTLGFVAAIVSNVVTWRVSRAGTTAAHRAWLREKRTDAYVELLTALNMRASRRHRGDTTTNSQTMISTTAFASNEVLELFSAAKDLDVAWLNAQTQAVAVPNAIPTPPEHVALRAASDASMRADDLVIERIRTELRDLD